MRQRHLTAIVTNIFVLFALKTSLCEATCGYESCNLGKKDVINVHMVPHTHDDVGWLKTVDQYYYGYKDGIQNAGVQYVIDTVVQALHADKNRRFSYVEMAFFHRWWVEQNNATKNIVKQLVNEGRLQFLLGGWCMNDEAAVHYTSSIDQMTKGLRFLNNTFGDCGRPRVSWQVDPFGHSMETANLFARMDFDALFFQRLDYLDKARRLLSRRMEFMWSGQPNANGKGGATPETSLFTSLTFGGYCQPAGFCFDVMCGDDPVMDDKRLHDYNVDKRVDDFLKYVLEHNSVFTSQHIMVPMGCDFQYRNAHQNFKNMDKLIHYLNQKHGNKVNAFYSTPSCYVKAVNKAAQDKKLTYTVKYNDDFFPYNNDAHSYWTGYFTSRAALKGFVAMGNSQYDAARKISVASNSTKSSKAAINMAALNKMGEIMGVVQHHDAVSGTEKQAVAFDYAQRIHTGLVAVQETMTDAISSLSGQKIKANNLMFCNLINISSCAASEENFDSLQVVLYNSLGWERNETVCLPVFIRSGESLEISDRNLLGRPALSKIDARTSSIPERNATKSKANMILSFGIRLLPLAVQTITVDRKQQIFDNVRTEFVKQVPIPQSQPFVIYNDYVRVGYNADGVIQNVTNLKTGQTHQMTIDMRYYEGFQGDNSKPIKRASGAYAFRPLTTDSLKITRQPRVTVHTSSFVTEVHQEFSEWATLVTRIYNIDSDIRIEWTVGPLPIKDKQGKEVIINYETDMNTNKTFFTDAQGRQTLQRTLFGRDVGDIIYEPVAMNYYPLNGFIYLKDRVSKFSVFVDRAEGGSSMKNGQIEVMVHRRTLRDDGFGVGEPLNETGSDGHGLIVRGEHLIRFDRIQNVHSNFRQTSLRRYFPANLLINKSPVSSMQINLLRKAFPQNVHLLTLQDFDDETSPTFDSTKKIIRLEHIYALKENPIYSVPVKIDLNDYFIHFKVLRMTPLSLGANHEQGSVHRLNWPVKSSKWEQDVKASSNKTSKVFATTVTLNPLDIVTLKLDVAYV